MKEFGRRLRAAVTAFTRNYPAATGGKNWPGPYDRWPSYAEMRAPVRQALAARYALAVRAAHQAANNPVAEAGGRSFDHKPLGRWPGGPVKASSRTNPRGA